MFANGFGRLSGLVNRSVNSVQPHVVTSIDGLICYLASSLICRGYFFYSIVRIPDGKDPCRVDAKLIARYEANLSRWKRAHRKATGRANVRCLRFENIVILIATAGESPYFATEKPKDLRRAPLKFGGYSLSFRNGHTSVRIERRQFAELNAFFLENASRRSKTWLERELGALPFLPFAPVRRQLLTIYRRVNRKRLFAGLEMLAPPFDFRPRAVKAFG